MVPSIVFLVIGLIIGGGGVYVFMQNEYQPIITDYETQLSDYSSRVDTLTSVQEVLNTENDALETQVTSLEEEVSTLESDLTNAEDQISEYEIEISSLEAEVSSLESEVTILQTEKSALQSEVSTLRSTVTQRNWLIDDLRDDVSELEDELSVISDIVVTQNYAWEFGSGWSATEYTWELPISLGTYLNYYFKDRPTEWADWVDIVNDPDDDYYITYMVQNVNEAAIRDGLSEIEKVNFVIDFVQSLPYTEDSVTTDWDEYPRYPIETLFDRGGDCEDTSILVAALLDRLGYEVCLIFPVDKNHVAVGIAIEDAYGSYYDHDGTRYFYLETTGEGWEIGDIPSDYEDSSAYIYPINP